MLICMMLSLFYNVDFTHVTQQKSEKWQATRFWIVWLNKLHALSVDKAQEPCSSIPTSIADSQHN